MNLVIRQAQPADAAACITHVQALSQEPDIYIALAAGEFNLTVEQEEQYIRDMLNSPNSLFLVAEVDGQLAGHLIMRGGSRVSNRHSATMAVAVSKDYRSQGLGRSMMQYAIDWANANDLLTRIEVYVFFKNLPALHLCESFGFQVEGHRHKAILRQSTYYDDLLMALLLEQ
jgi:RimJ/RimL family protein N-acetyltransferase